jgi:hypothetical protein
MRMSSSGLVVAMAVLAACGGGGGGGTGPSPYGSVQVTINGLPGGTAARVTLVGPGGLIRTFTSSGILTGATPGTWAVQARHVAVGGLDYLAAAPASITVVAPDTTPLAVGYTPVPLSTVDYVVSDAELYQSVQRDDNSVPIVAGRPAFLRVFVTANQASGAVPAVRVRLYSPTGLFDSLTIPGPPVQVPLSVDRGNLTTSWNVNLAAAQVVKGLRLEAIVDPDDDIGESNETDNRWPSAGPLALDVRSVPAFKLKLVPVRQSVNQLTGAVNAANQATFADLASRVYPLNQVNVTLRSTYTTSAPALQSNDGNGAWGTVLSEIYTLQQADPGNATYYGVVATSYSGGIAGLGYVGAPAAIGWDKQPSAGGVAAHELGHTFGRSHAPCGTSPADPNYPYPNAEIGVWGYDQVAGVLKDPVGFADLMSYCSPAWISDYTYEGVLTYRGPGPMIVAAPDSGLLVWGRMRGDSLILEPAFMVKAPARLPAADGPYRLTGLASDGAELFQLSFAGVEVPDLPGGAERHFAFVIPLAEAAPARLASLVLTGPRGTALRSTAALGGAAPDVAVTSAGADQVQVSWDRRYPMALVRDARTGEILAFARGGSAVVTATGPVAVELSRGTGSVRATQKK